MFHEVRLKPCERDVVPRTVDLMHSFASVKIDGCLLRTLACLCGVCPSDLHSRRRLASSTMLAL
jgi:hypothetical protein